MRIGLALTLCLVSCTDSSSLSTKAENLRQSKRPAAASPEGDAAAETRSSDGKDIGKGVSESGVKVDPETFIRELKLGINGLPETSSDKTEFDMQIFAAKEITHYSYKVGSKESCLKSEGYQITAIGEKPHLVLGPELKDTVAVCLLFYYAPAKHWQAVKASTILSWKRVNLIGTYESEYEEYDEECGKNVKTLAKITFADTGASYVWTRDPALSGCKGEVLSGTDTLLVSSSTGEGIKGTWSWAGTEVTGWFDFKWADFDRKTFKGSFGYGTPDTEPAGPWNSIPH